MRGWLTTHSARLRASLDLSATVLSVVTCLAVCWLLAVDISQRRARSAGVSSDVLEIGSVVSDPNLSFGSTELTLLVGLSSSCRFCTESMPALRLLSDYAERRGGEHMRVLAVGYEPAPVLARYLEENGLTTFRSMGIDREAAIAPVAKRTPSLVAVDRGGKVLASWSGRMTTAQMDQVLVRLAGRPTGR
jgi:hypothetical protein